MRFSIFSIIAIMLLVSSAVCAEVIAPLAFNINAIGGGALNQYTPGVENGVGLNNIGLLIKTWGKVSYVAPDNTYFYINDGSNRNDGSGHIGLRVACDNLADGASITPPIVNTYVAITGISSTIVIETKIQPNFRPRGQSDIQPIAQ